MVKKRINTVLDEDLWKQAMIRSIKWSEALEIGIVALLGINTKKGELQTKKHQLSAEMEVIELELRKIDEKQAEIKKKDQGNLYKVLE